MLENIARQGGMGGYNGRNRRSGLGRDTQPHTSQLTGTDDFLSISESLCEFPYTFAVDLIIISFRI